MSISKKIITVSLVCAIALAMLGVVLSVPQVASADPDLPFELVAPQNVNLTKDNIGDSHTTLGYAFSVTNAMNEFFVGYGNAVVEGELAEYLASKGVDYATEMWMLVQIDWALDDVDDAVSGWHYNAYWDEAPLGTLGQDAEGFYHCSSWDVVDMGVDATSTVSNTWLYRDMNEWEWTGGENSVGVRDQLRSSQYTYQYFSDTDDSQVFIDWNEHTMYNRSRFVIVLRDETEDSYIFSPWSDVAAYGKDAETVEPLAPGDVPAPVITGLRLSDEQFNDNPVVAFTLTVPEDLATKAAQLAARNDIIRVEVEARVAGTSEWTNLNVGGNVTTGELEAALVYLAQPGNPLPDGTQVELRARYLVMQQGRDDFYSAYSKIIGFGSDEIVDHGSSGDHAGESGGEEGGGSILDILPKSDCKLCHICPVQPLGICLFVWIAIAVAVLLVVVIVVIIIKKVKQNKDRNNQ